MKRKIITIAIVAILTLAIAVPVAASATSTVKGGSSLLDYAKTLIQQLVTDKKLAQADADAVLKSLDQKQQELQANRPAKVDKGLASGLGLDATASLLGMSVEDLQARLQAGSTLWKTAAEAGKLEDLKNAIIKQVSTQFDALVTAGRLTKDEAATKLADVTARIKAITADSKASLSGLVRSGIDGKGNRGRMDGGMKRGPQDGAKQKTVPDRGTAQTAPSTKSTAPANQGSDSSS